MPIEEVIYNGRSNTIALSLTSDNAVIVHNTLSRCQVYVDAMLIDSNVSPALFDLTNADRLLLKFGQAGLAAGSHTATLVVFDALNINGLVWDSFVLVVK